MPSWFSSKSSSQKTAASSSEPDGSNTAVITAQKKQISDQNNQTAIEAFSNINASTIESIELIPEELVIMIAFLNTGAKEIIFHYLFNIGDMDNQKNYVWLKQPATIHTFFGIPTSQKQILALAEYAGSLDQMEYYILKAYARQESHLQTTLVQAIRLAVIGLDQDIVDENGKILDDGMAEKLLALHKKLFPNDQSKALKAAQEAAPLETKDTKDAREKANVEAINQLFNAFVQNDAVALPIAINIFTAIVSSTKPTVITNRLYYLNLLHLLHIAFDILARRGGELPAIEGDHGQWYGELANRFCFQIIGAVIQNDLPHRAKQLLISGIYYLFLGNKKAPRHLDISGAYFRGDGTDFLLGVNSYYAALADTMMAAVAEVGDDSFKTYYEQSQQQPKFIISHTQPHPVSQCLTM
ncbi:hypothetical protein AYO45_04765 [Gammaproteobacteria bacterium SCGC AG-212-F23]|nr:hypothetical protein AYO45_04765 [Gammaproteobacteria bacterium SCGC AG-212-F23]